MLGNASPRVSVPGEIIPSHEFYDYDDKYVDGAAEMVIPADLPPDVTDEVRPPGSSRRSPFCAARAWHGSTSSTRRTAGGVLLNEVNTIPGFTPWSMYPSLWEAQG